MKKVLVIIVCGVLLAGGLYVARAKPTQVTPEISYAKKEVTLGNTRYILEVADTDFLRERGLSYRTSLAPQTGMLFVFDTPRVSRFWMKDMNFPIDIIWLSEDLKVVYIKKDARPEFFPETYEPKENAKYVLEVVSGFSGKNNLKEGDKVKFTY